MPRTGQFSTPSLFLVLAACAAEGPQGDSEGDRTEQAALAAAEDLENAAHSGLEDHPFVHPLQKAVPVGGLLPIVETQDAPDGRRYALLETNVVGEQGEELAFSGIAELDIAPLDADGLARYKASKIRLPWTPLPVVREELAARLERSPRLTRFRSGEMDRADFAI